MQKQKEESIYILHLIKEMLTCIISVKGYNKRICI